MMIETTQMPATQTYNGWANYETWNVTLWINNNEFLYNTAYACVEYYDPSVETPYEKFIRCMMNCDKVVTNDGVRWDHPKINHDEVNEMLIEYFNEEQV